MLKRVKCSFFATMDELGNCEQRDGTWSHFDPDGIADCIVSPNNPARMGCQLRGVVKKKNGYFMVRLTVRVDPRPPPPDTLSLS